MRISHRIRAAVVALTAFACFAPSAALADSGTIAFRVVKAGWVIGGSGGSGTLLFHGRRYPLAIGGGSQFIVLRNEKGAELALSGRQVGLQINADLSGLAISFR